MPARPFLLLSAASCRHAACPSYGLEQELDELHQVLGNPVGELTPPLESMLNALADTTVAVFRSLAPPRRAPVDCVAGR